MTATTTSQADRLRMLAGELLQRERWSRDQLVAYQQRAAARAARPRGERSPYYREALGDDPPAVPLEQLPTLSKPTLMEQWDRIVCDPRLRRADVEAHAASPHADEPYLGEYQVFSTSGASGLRGLFVYGAARLGGLLAHTMRALARTGARPWRAHDRHRRAARRRTCPSASSPRSSPAAPCRGSRR